MIVLQVEIQVSQHFSFFGLGDLGCEEGVVCKLRPKLWLLILFPTLSMSLKPLAVDPARPPSQVCYVSLKLLTDREVGET